MPESPAQVVILICCYNGRPHLHGLFASLMRSDDGEIDRRIVLVDNASTDGSADEARARCAEVDCVRLEHNRGFTGGNNAGFEHIQQHYPEADYLVLLNVDTVVESGWLRQMVRTMREHPNVGAAQPTLVLHPDAERINTVGNRSHYLGFGMMQRFGEPRSRQNKRTRIDFPSGAAVMLSMPVMREVGLFDERFYMYLEDADLGWKLRQLGYTLQRVPASHVQHKYRPDAPSRYYRHLERNRWLLLLTYYKWRTLALLAPALLAMEVGQVLYAATQGALGQKLASWGDLLRPSGWRIWRERRRLAQQRRVISDRDFMGGFAGRVHLPTGDPWLLRAVANPCLRGYWRLARRLIRW